MVRNEVGVEPEDGRENTIEGRCEKKISDFSAAEDAVVDKKKQNG